MVYQRSTPFDVQFQIRAVEVDGVNQVSVRGLQDDGAASFGCTGVNGALDFGGVLRPPTKRLPHSAPPCRL